VFRKLAVIVVPVDGLVVFCVMSLFVVAEEEYCDVAGVAVGIVVCGKVAEGLLKIDETAVPMPCPAVSLRKSARTRSRGGKSNSLSFRMMVLASLRLSSEVTDGRL